MKRLIVFLALAAGACGALPQDFSGTSDRVRSEHAFRVGMIAGSDTDRCSNQAGPFLARVAAAAGARAQVRRGPAEPLLAALRGGELDLVLGAFDRQSPWKTEVAILEPISRGCEQDAAFIAAARNGENRWIMLLEHEVRALQRESGSGA